MQIKRLAPVDYDRVLDLWLRAGLPIRASGRDSKEAFSRQLTSGTQTILGYKKDGDLIGVIVATHDSRKGWINRLAVDPNWQRQGIGSLLIEAAEEELKRQGVKVIAALIFESNVRSIAAFKKAGYEADTRIRYFSKRHSENA